MTKDRYTSNGWEGDVWQSHPDPNKIYYRGIEMDYVVLPSEGTHNSENLEEKL